jgi:hypothetical protein
MNAAQTEFPLTVSVCAWCKPYDRGPGFETVSHGICPRHLRKLKLESKGIATQAPRRRYRKNRHPESWLPL